MSNRSDGSASIKLLRKCSGGSGNDQNHSGMEQDIESANAFAVNEALPVAVDAINVMDCMVDVINCGDYDITGSVHQNLNEAINDFCDNFKDK